MPDFSMFDLTGKRALITGSSRGLGLTFAEGLAAAGAEIILNSRDPEALGDAAKSIADRGGKVSALAFDVTSPDSINDAIAHAEENIGPIDILVNNAGMLTRAPLQDLDTDRFDRLMTTNVSSVFYVTKAVAPFMLARKCGKIINVSSISATRGRPSNIAYAASKAAITSMTQSMAADLAPHGIHVNAIAPGFISGGMNVPNVANPAYTDWITSRTPMARWGRPDELIGAMVFLASSASDFVNGHVLAVDGGAAATML